MVYEFLYLVVNECDLSLSVFLSFLALQGYIIMSEVILNNLLVYAGEKNQAFLPCLAWVLSSANLLKESSYAAFMFGFC